MSAQRRRAYLTRPETARASNERIAARAQRYRFTSRVPMLCECSDESCGELFLISLDDYREARTRDLFLTVPEHVVEDAAPVGREADYWLQAASG